MAAWGQAVYRALKPCGLLALAAMVAFVCGLRGAILYRKMKKGAGNPKAQPFLNSLDACLTLLRLRCPELFIQRHNLHRPVVARRDRFRRVDADAGGNIDPIL